MLGEGLFVSVSNVRSKFYCMSQRCHSPKGSRMVGMMFAFSSLRTQVRVSIPSPKCARDMSPMRYGLFDEIHLLSSKAFIEDRVLVVDWSRNGSERQRGAEQRCEEHCRFELEPSFTRLSVGSRSKCGSNVNNGVLTRCDWTWFPCSRTLPAQAPMSICSLTWRKHHNWDG